MSDTNSDNPDGLEAARPSEQAPSHLLSPEETPSAGDPVPVEEPNPGLRLVDQEPSLHLFPDSPESAAESPEPDTMPPGSDVDFPSLANSPDIPGASSVMIHQWDPRDSQPQSPRSEQSTHSSVYPSASRTSTAGGSEPFRTLIRSRDPKADLNSGDVVMLMHQGRPYVAIQARLPYKTDAVHTVLELPEEGSPPQSEALSYLEIVKQGSFLGFRSGAAGNRFMQPRRKAPHWLVFYNHNCGVWEQWDVLGDAWRTAAWSAMPIVFKSRRLPQVELTVEVVRVGYFSSPGHISLPPPRALLPVIPEGPQLEDRNLRRITDLLVAEWFKFVDHEKVLREGLEADLATLAGETQELKLRTIQQVEYLRLHMNEEMASLSHHVALRDNAIATLRSWLRRAQQLAADRMARHRHRRILMAWRFVVDDIVFYKSAILKLHRKRAKALREAVFRAWNQRTRAALGTAVKLRFAVQRRSHALMSRVFKGWQEAMARRAWRARTMLAAVQRRATRRLAATFGAWRLLTLQRAMGRRALLRALQGVNQSWLAAALTAWRAAAQAVNQKAVQAELLVARRAARLQAAALLVWRDLVLYNTQVDRHARTAKLRRTLHGWRQATGAARTATATAEALAADRLEVLRREVLLSWRVVAAMAASLEQRLLRHAVARSVALQGRALAAWSLAARERRRRRVVLQRHLAATGLCRATAVLAGWRAVATKATWRRGRMMIALSRAASKKLAAALLSWHAYTTAHRAVARRAALAASKVRRMRLVACLGAWSQVATRMRAARTNLLALCKKMLRYTVSATFREWRLLTATATASRTAVARALPASTRDLLTRVLAIWWSQHCAAFAPLEIEKSGGHVAPARLAAYVSTDGAAVAGPALGYATEAAAAATAARTPLGYGTASPRQSQFFSRDTAAQITAMSVSSRDAGTPSDSRGFAVSVATAAERQLLCTSEVPSQPHLLNASVSVPASDASAPSQDEQPTRLRTVASVPSGHGSQHPISPVSSAGDAAAALTAGGAFAVAPALVEPVMTAAATPMGSPLPQSSGMVSAPPTASRPPTYPQIGTVGPLPPRSAMPTQRRLDESSGGGSSAAADMAAPDGAGAAAFATRSRALPSELSLSFPAALTTAVVTPPVRSGRSYREALVAGSAGRRVSGGSSHGGHSNGNAGPFVPASAPVIGAGSSPMLVDMAPGRNSEGPMTPIGLPELLDGPVEELSDEGSSSAGFGSEASAAGDGVDEARAAEAETATAGALALADVSAAPQPVDAMGEVRRAEAAAAVAAAERSVSPSGSPAVSRSLAFSFGAEAEAEQLERLRSVSLAPAVQPLPNVRSHPLAAAVSRRPVAATTELAMARSGLGRWVASAVLSHWRRAVEARHRWKAALEVMAVARRREVLGDVLGAWWEAAASSRARVEAAETLAVKAGARNSRQCLREALDLWRSVARRRAVNRTVLGRHLARLEMDAARRVLLEWHDVVAGWAARERRVQRHLTRREQLLLASAMRAWRDEAEVGAARRAIAGELAAKQARSLMTFTLAGWSDAAVARRERAARQARAARHAVRRRLVGAFRVWRWAAEAAGERQAVAVHTGRTAALRAAFSGWLRTTSGGFLYPCGLDPEASMQRAAAWHQRRLLRGCFTALAENREAHLGHRKVAVAHCCHSTCAAVLEAWQGMAVWARWGATAASRMRSRAGQRLQARCLASWMGVTEAAAAARRAAEQMALRRERDVAAALLAGWQVAATDSAARRAQEQAALRRISRGCAQRVLMVWNEAAARRRVSRLRHQVACRRLEGQRLRRILAEWAAYATDMVSRCVEADRRLAAANTAHLSLGFAGWADLTQGLRAARATATTRGSVANLALLRHAMAAWTAAIERARAVSTAAEAMSARRAAALLPAALRAWADVACEDEARRLQVAALRSLTHRRRMAFARRTFVAWREVLIARQLRDDDLRRCIKRKRIAFSLFKQWYWEAFDADVQATIWRMFHSTDPAAHSPQPSNRTGQRPPYPALQQPLPPYMMQHQQYVNRRAAAGASYGGANRAGDLPPLDLDPDMSTADSAAAAADYHSRPGRMAVADGRGIVVPPHPATHSHSHQPLHTGRSGGRATTTAAAGYRTAQSRPTHPVATASHEPEAVRILASTFDAVAHLPPAVPAGSRPRGATAVFTPLAAGGRRGAAAAPASVAPPRSAAYPLLRSADSDESEERLDIRELAAVAVKPARSSNAAPSHRDLIATTTATVSSSRPPSRPAAAAAAVPPARRATLAVASIARTASGGHSSVCTAAAAAASNSTARRATISSGAAARRPSIGRAGAVAPAAKAGSSATPVSRRSGDAAAAGPGLEAMSAALNVAIRSLDLAAGVINSNAGATTAAPFPATVGRLSRSGTLSSIGSAPAPLFYGRRVSVDGSISGAAGMPLSPLSPGAPYGSVYGTSPGTGGLPTTMSAELPGVVPTWRRVANNQLYSCDEDWSGELYSNDLGPVVPMYAGITGTGASLGLPDFVVADRDGHAGAVGEGEEGQDGGEDGGAVAAAAAEAAATRLAAAMSIRSMLLQQQATGLVSVTGGSAAGVAGSELGDGGAGGSTTGGSAVGSHRVSSDGGGSSTGCFFPRHSIFRNAVFQPRAEERDVDESGRDGDGTDLPIRHIPAAGESAVQEDSEHEEVAGEGRAGLMALVFGSGFGAYGSPQAEQSPSHQEAEQQLEGEEEDVDEERAYC